GAQGPAPARRHGRWLSASARRLRYGSSTIVCSVTASISLRRNGRYEYSSSSHASLVSSKCGLLGSAEFPGGKLQYASGVPSAAKVVTTRKIAPWCESKRSAGLPASSRNVLDDTFTVSSPPSLGHQPPSRSPPKGLLKSVPCRSPQA